MLSCCPAFAGAWETRLYTNYIREQVPDAALEKCDLFIYQRLTADWGELASDTLLGKLSAKALSICIPNMFFKGYWPFWTSSSPMDFGDSLLDKLIDSGADKSAILKVYCYGNINNFVDLQENFQAGLRLEKEKESYCAIKTTALVEEFWRREMLFFTCNHPALRLLRHVAGEILRLLELPGLTAQASAFVPEYADFELPIHPQAAACLGLAFAADERRVYNIFGRPMTFLQYISRYIDCRRQDCADSFLGYLQLV